MQQISAHKNEVLLISINAIYIYIYEELESESKVAAIAQAIVVAV